MWGQAARLTYFGVFGIGGIILGALALINLVGVYWDLGLGPVLQQIVTQYQAIVYPVFDVVLSWLPWQLPSIVKDLMAVYIVFVSAIVRAEMLIRFQHVTPRNIGECAVLLRLTLLTTIIGLPMRLVTFIFSGGGVLFTSMRGRLRSLQLRVELTEDADVTEKYHQKMDYLEHSIMNDNKRLASGLMGAELSSKVVFLNVISAPIAAVMFFVMEAGI